MHRQTFMKVKDRERERQREDHREKRKEVSFGHGMDKILRIFTDVGGEASGRSDDDSVDRLNRRYTTFFLILFAILVSTKQYVGEPINCWVPAQFTSNHEIYTDKVCWVSNTYYVPFKTKQISDETEPSQKICYYQWIPMILLSQAVLFYLPCLAWRVINKRSGLNLRLVVETAQSCSRSETLCGDESREKTIKYIVNHVDVYLGARQPERGGCWNRIKAAMAKRCIFIFGRVYGNNLTCVYLGIKILYVINTVSQLFALNFFLDTDYHMFGIHVMTALLRGADWRASSRFPRVTLCDFEVRVLGNVHRHTVQCVLPINLFNEKIFVFIWFWFAFVTLMTVLSFLYWLAKALNRRGQEHYILRQLHALEKLSHETESRTIKFTRDYMRQDGVFIMRLIGKNAGDIVAAEIIAGLWDIYVREERLLVDNRPTSADPGIVLA